MTPGSRWVGLALASLCTSWAWAQGPPPLPEPPPGQATGADSASERARIRRESVGGQAPAANPAVIGDEGGPAATDSALGDPAAAPGAPAVPGPAGGRDTVIDESAPTLVQVLKERVAKLDARRAELDEEETRLQSLRVDIAARLAELSALRVVLDERMSAFSGELDARRAEQLKKLVKAMQSMPPEAAAGMAAEMEEGIVVRVFDRMKGRNVAKVLAAMPAPLAASIGQRLALYRAGLAKTKEAGP